MNQFLFILEFNNENIVEPIMYVYKDFNYVNYVLGLNFYNGYSLFKVCKNRIVEESDRYLKDRLWHSYLLESQNGFKWDFETYCKMRTVKPDIINNEEYIDKEETRLLNKYNKPIDISKYKRRKI